MGTLTRKREEELAVLTSNKGHIITTRWERKRIQSKILLKLAGIATSHHRTPDKEQEITQFHQLEKTQTLFLNYLKFKTKIKVRMEDPSTHSLLATRTKRHRFWLMELQRKVHTRASVKSKLVWVKVIRKVQANIALKSLSKLFSSNRRDSKDKFQFMTMFRSTFLQVVTIKAATTQDPLVPASHHQGKTLAPSLINNWTSTRSNTSCSKSNFSKSDFKNKRN